MSEARLMASHYPLEAAVTSLQEEEARYIPDGDLFASLVDKPGNDYLKSVPVDRRRRVGQVYTPRHLADFILDQTGYVPVEAIEDRTLLDPSCGAGVFLIAAVQRLVARLQWLGVDTASVPGRRRVLRSVAANFFGVDTDPTACELARAAIRSELARLLCAPVHAKFFARNITCADYLLRFRPVRLSRRRSAKIDFIVGNPPYVATTRISAAYKERLRKRFRTASGRLDLYTLFMERSLTLLADGGRMAFITPNKFLVSMTSRPLRALLLAEGAIRTIANFRSHKVFDDAATVPCITVFERGASAGFLTVLECHDRPAPNGDLPIVARSSIDHAHLDEGPWHLAGGDLRALAGAVCRDHPRLATFASRVSAGIATGCDGVFVLPASTAAGIEPELRRSAIRGRDLAAYEINDAQLDIIMPYVYDAFGRPRLTDLARYPKARAYLSDHRALLEKRHCCRVWEKAWYDIHDPVPFDVAAQPKILVPDVARSNRFAFDAGRYCPLHSAYYLIPKDIDPLYLTAVLNSTPVEFLIRMLAPTVKDGFSRYRRQFLLDLPVPIAPESQMRAIAAAARARDHERVEQLVAPLFALAPKERDGLERFLSSLAGRNGNRRTLVTDAGPIGGS